MLVAVAIGFIAVTGIATGVTFNVDIAIALGLVGFLATVAFARFVMSRAGARRTVPIADRTRGTMIDAFQNYLAAGLIVIGSLFALTASIGLLRLPDLYTRMHAASKAGTLGSCVMLLALAVHSNDHGNRAEGAGRRPVFPADRADLFASAGESRAWRGLSLVGTFHARRSA